LSVSSNWYSGSKSRDSASRPAFFVDDETERGAPASTEAGHISVARLRRASARSVRRPMSGFDLFVLVVILALPAIVIATVVFLRNRR
jgi:hypothetical protein